MKILAMIAGLRMLAPLAAPAGVLIIAVGIGWPWGAVAAAGCLALPVLAVMVLHRLSLPRVRDGRRRPLRVIAVRLAPEISRASKALPGTAGDAITEGKRP